MDVHISNNSGQTAYFVLWGLTNLGNTDSLKKSARWCYYKLSGTSGDVSATITNFPTPEAKEGKSVDFAPDLYELASGSSFTIKNAPYLYSGNATFSLGSRPKLFTIVPSWKSKGVISPYFGGFGVQSPGYMPTDADADTKFVSCEFTYQPPGDYGGVYADTTNVDYFCFPITITVEDDDNTSSTTGDMKDGKTRTSVFNSFNNITDPKYTDFKKLVYSDVRIYAPGHGIDAGLFPADYLDTAIADAWNFYTGKTADTTLTVNVEGTFAGSYAGSLNAAGALDFTGVGSFTKPTTKQAFLCAGGPFPTGNTKLAAVGARLGAGINRNVLLSSKTQPYCQNYYASSPCNYYSKLLHDNLNSVYGFAYDDVCTTSSSPLLHSSNPKKVTIDLAAWS